MFTGLVTAVGTVQGAHRSAQGLDLRIDAPYPDLIQGESLAVDGACLTVQDLATGSFGVRVVATSLERTRFGEYAPGHRVNLERALRVGDRLGGHLVQGHVDGVGTVTLLRQRDDAWLLEIRVPDEISRFSVPLGSITVDGVSLTVNAIPDPNTIQVSLIPFTLQHTTLGERRAGDRVHLEADTIGKYVAAFLEGRDDAIRHHRTGHPGSPKR